MSNVNVLVTGGAGYVGSHVIVELLGAGCDVVVADNFHNSRRPLQTSPLSSSFVHFSCSTRRIYVRHESFYGYKASEEFFKLLQHRFDCVIHAAGYKSVGESWKAPLEYYSNNIGGAIRLVE
ncbi:UDP-glucose 4-epimerase, putative, partial [Ixodes scapularis]